MMEWSECQNLEVYLGSYCENLARAYIKLEKYWKNAQLIPFWSPSLIPISDLPKIDQDYWHHKLLDISKNKHGSVSQTAKHSILSVLN